MKVADIATIIIFMTLKCLLCKDQQIQQPGWRNFLSYQNHPIICKNYKGKRTDKQKCSQVNYKNILFLPLRNIIMLHGRQQHTTSSSNRSIKEE